MHTCRARLHARTIGRYAPPVTPWLCDWEAERDLRRPPHSIYPAVVDKRHGHHGEHHAHDRSGAKQPQRFDPARAAMLDDPQRFEYLPPAEIIAALDPPSGGTVVDFGTGTGAFAIEMARRRPDLRIVAYDEQPGMLDLLQAKPEAARLANLEPVLSDRGGEMAGIADRILALNVLHEVGDEALALMIGMLKQGGSILFIDWDAEIERPVGPPRDHTYSAREARERLERAGLAVKPLERWRYHFVLSARRA